MQFTSQIKHKSLANTFLYTGFFTTTLFGLSACGALPGFTVNAKTDEFKQTAQRNDKIDILFVVDNSGSMANNQEVLAQSFADFISKFSDKKLNFQVGVISTDNVQDAAWWSSTSLTGPYHDIINNGPGSLLAYKTNEKILRPDTQDLVTKFQQNAKLGTHGSGAEAAMKSVTIALGDSMLGAGGWNEGLVRSEAMLAVIIVSDEDESITTGANATLKSRYIRGLPADAAPRKQAFEDQLRAVKPKADLLSLTTIVSTSAAECSDVFQNGDSLWSTGDFYMEAARDMNGTIIPVCKDFAGPLEDLGSNLVKYLSRFQLKQKPDGQIQVFVNGVVVERNATNGWDYLADTNEVEFRGDAIPSADAKIEVAYVPGEPLR